MRLTQLHNDIVTPNAKHRATFQLHLPSSYPRHQPTHSSVPSTPPQQHHVSLVVSPSIHLANHTYVATNSLRMQAGRTRMVAHTSYMATHEHRVARHT
jgi:hypothetical protein